MKKGAFVRDSLDENELGEDQDLVDPDEAVHERLRQDFFSRLVLKRIRKRQLARRGIVEVGKEVPDFSVIVDFFDSSFYFCRILFGYDCDETFK